MKILLKDICQIDINDDVTLYFRSIGDYEGTVIIRFKIIENKTEAINNK